MVLLPPLQEELHLWRKYNFPEADDTQQFEGMAEEVGELAKARLKRIQGIRPEVTGEAKEKNAIGDLIIYALGYCSCRGWNFEHILESVADEVMKRDWITYPKNGVTE